MTGQEAGPTLTSLTQFSASWSGLKKQVGQSSFSQSRRINISQLWLPGTLAKPHGSLGQVSSGCHAKPSETLSLGWAGSALGRNGQVE